MTSATTGTTTAASGAIQFTGLASGLDTASIIDSLMQVESQPQTNLKNAVTAQQAQVSALQSINANLASLGTAAQSFLTGSTWTQLSATASNSAFSVTAASTATKADVNVVVNRSATSAAAVLSSTALSGVTAGSTYTINSGTTPTTFTVGGTGSLSDIATAINGSSQTSGLRAMVIDPTGATPSLEIVSSTTGASSNFSITGTAGTLVDTSATSTTTGITTTGGVDASLSVDGVGMTSSSNTVTILSGVQLTIPSGVTSASPVSSSVSVSDDGSARANALSQFVQQINSVLTTISSATAYGTITAGQAPTGGGLLAGNGDLRGVASQLVNTIFAPGDTISLANMGLSVDDTGQLTFDSGTFESAYQADPAGVQAAFTGTGGFIDRVSQVATQASDPIDGTITASITSMNTEIKNENDSISDWDVILSQKQASLEKTYSNLETQLATMQSQSTWLSSELSGLDAGWSQNSSSS